MVMRSSETYPEVTEKRNKLETELKQRWSGVLFAEQIKRKLSAVDLAKKLEISTTLLSKYKNMKSLPSIIEFARITDELGIDPQTILFPSELDTRIAKNKELQPKSRRKRDPVTKKRVAQKSIEARRRRGKLPAKRRSRRKK
jgi:transcriptional regulator with XRE-family HTH domain